MHRDIHTAKPADGDYIISFTGLSWNVLRRTSRDSAMSVCTGDRDRKTALARIRTLTEQDGADGWETAGSDLFRQVTRFRR